MLDPYIYRASVLRIVDGDTLHLDIDLGFNNIHLTDSDMRLYGLDTPEIPPHARSLKEGRAGTLVKEFIQNLLNGKTVFVKSYKDKVEQDIYSRYLVDIYLSNEDGTPSINSLLLSKGYARPDDGSHLGEWDDSILDKIIMDLGGE